MKVLVTGGSGFVGTNLIDYYNRAGCDVVNIDIVAPRNPSHHRYWRRLDIRDEDALCNVVGDLSPNLILHMAARTDLNGLSLDDYSANTDGVLAIIKAARNLPDLRRLLFASSMLVCALGYSPINDLDYCPTTRYGESKMMGEQYIRKMATGCLPWTIVRPTSLWGPWFAVPYRTFFDSVAKRMYMHPKGHKVLRSYGFVLNSAYQLSRIASCEDPDLVEGKTLYLSDYQPIELLQWARVISERFCVPPPREVSLGLLKCVASLGDILKQTGLADNPPLTSFRLRNLLTNAVFDTRLLEAISGTLPYGLEQGVATTIEWMQNNG